MMNRIIHGLVYWVVGIGLMIGSVGCSSSQSFQTHADRLSISTMGGESVELPAEFDGYKVVLDVMLNGTGPHRMILDTGSAVSQVPPEVAKAAGIEESGRVRTLDAHGNVNKEPIGLVSSVEIGGLVGHGVPFTIDRLPERIAEGPKIIGIIGYNMFRNHTLTLDYPNEQVFVSHARLDSDSIGTVPMWLENGRVPFIDGGMVIPGSKGTLPCDMLIDTGSGALLNLSGMHAQVYSDLENKVQVGVSMSSSGTVEPNEYARLIFDLGFQGIYARNLMAIVSRSTRSDSSIGGEFMRRFRVSLDPVGKHFRVELSDGRTEIDMPIWRVHGIRIALDEDDQFVVRSVVEGSPAELGGVQEGDVLLAFDGIPLTLEPFNWPGPVLDDLLVEREYLISRDGAEQTLVLAFQDFIPIPKMKLRLQDTADQVSAPIQE